MKTISTRIWIVLGVLCFAGILRATVPLAVISNWTASSSLSQARANSAAVMLSNSSILFTGGSSGGSVLQTAEVYGVNGAVAAVSAMNVPRNKHIAVVLSDGRVLVGGGNTSGGGTTNSAEIYDPSSDTWIPTGPMTSARANATAALLQDGRVLIAGGDSAGAPNNTVEIYDPASGSFTFAGTLSAARTQHAMAGLPDGRILIVGGFDGNNPLASSDIFDPANGAITAGPSLNTARYGASATTLMNGQVVIIGGLGQGSNGTVDLASIEIFDNSSDAFSDAGVSLNTARAGHQAFLLPNNNNVLIVGGTSGGTALASAELITPHISPGTGAWTYAVSSTGSLTTARVTASGSANQVNGPTSAVQRPGVVVVGGGTDPSGNAMSSTEVYGYATAQTDQGDYPPGSTVTISGSGFKPGETVNITLVESPLIDTHGPYTAVADGNGNFSDSSFTTDIHDLNVRFWLSAVGSQSGLVVLNTFTDATATNTTLVSTPNPANVNQSVTLTATVRNGNVQGSGTLVTVGSVDFYDQTGITNPNCGGSTGIHLGTAQAVSGSGTATISTSFTLAGAYKLGACYNGTGGSGTQNSQSPSITQNVTGTVNTTTVVTSSVNPSVYGNSVTFTAKVHASTGSTAPTGTVTFTIDGTPGSAVALGVCSPPSSTDSCATASTSTLTVAGSSHSVSVNYSHTGNFSDSSGNLSGGETVNALPITATLTAQDKTYDGTAIEPNANMSCTLSGVLAADSVNVSCTATNGTFNGSNVGPHTVTATVTINGSAAANYTLGAAGTNLSSTTATASANITTSATTATLTAQDKVYDGTNTEPNANMTCSFSGVLAADAANVTCTPSNGTFNTSQVATANQVTATVTISGSAAGNYTLGAAGTNTASTSASATAHIKTAPLSATLVAQDKTYDGTATEPNANMTCSFSGVLAADAANVTCTPSNGTFNTSQVASANQVTATVTISGSAAGNYTLGAAGSSVSSTGANATAHIKTAPLTATLIAADKVYDGTNTEPNANMTCSFSGVLAADAANVTCTPSNGTFNTSQVATANQVTATVTIGGSAAGNYTLGVAGTSVSSTSANATAHIKTVPLTATLTAADKVYDGTNTEPNANMSCSFNGVVAADNITCTPTNGTFNTSQVASANQVTATVTIGGSAAGNYTLRAAGSSVSSASATATAHIKTAPLTATLIATDKVYDGTNSEPSANMSCSFNGVVGADTGNVTCTPTNGTFNTSQVATVNQVTATVTIGGSAAGNYTLGVAGTSVSSTSANAAAHIQTAPLSAALVAQDKIYDGTATEPNANMSCSLTGVLATDAGNASCVATNGMFNSSQVTIANQVNATVTISGSAAGNYTLGAAGTNLSSTSSTATAHIKTAPLTAILIAADKVYDGTNTEPNANMSCSFNGVVAADNITCTPTNGTFNTSQVASANQVTATVVIGGSAAGNYTLGAAGTSVSSANATASANIKTAPLTATLTAADKAYDGSATEPDLNMSCSLTGVVPSDGGNVSCTASNGMFNSSQVAIANQVNATAGISGAAAGNYTLGAAGTNLSSTTATATAYIKTAPLTVTLTAADKVYDGADVEPNANMSCSFVGIVALDSSNVTCAPSNGAFNSPQVATANQVTATVTLGGSAAGNYTLGAAGSAVTSTPATATAHIKTAPLTTALTAQDKQYDGTTTELDTSMHCSFTGAVASDNLNITCTASNGAFDSTDVLTASRVTATVTIGGSAGGNYTLGAAGTTVPFTSETANAHITPKPVTATITASDKTYDGNDAEPNANMHCNMAPGSAEGSDDVGCIATNGTFNSSQVLTANTVTATVSLTGTTASNYSLTSATAAVPANITPKSVTAVLTAADKIYDGDTTEPNASMHCALAVGFVVGTDDVSCVASSGTFNSSQVLTANTVTASVALAGTAASDYSLIAATTTASAHITPKTVTVSFNGADRNYDGTTNAAVSNCQIASGKVGSDDLGCTVAPGTFALKDASPNPKTVSATATLTGTAASDYSVTNPVTTTATISPAPITVTADPQTKIFGQVDPPLTYKVMNGALNTLFTGDSFSGALSRVAGENVGTYAIQQGTLTAGSNYTISYVDANLTITQASSATVVVSSPNPSVLGQNVNFTASVTDTTPGSTGTPTGSVQFYIDGVLSGTASLNVSGQASIMTSALAVGGHAVYAKYLGDQNFIGSTSAGINHAVNKANTSVAVATSGSPSILNAPVTFTATITVVSPGSGAPTGTVTFYLDSTLGTQLGTAAVSGGAASITTSAVPVNSHTIIAVYSGDGSFNTSSGSVTQLVQYLSSGMCAGDVGHAIRQPINQDGSSVWKANATVPAKFAVCNANGVSIGTPGIVTAFNLITVVKGTVTTSVNEVPDSTTPDNAFRWDPTARQWIFNINTKSAPVNIPNQTYVFRILLNDGSNITFQFGLR